MKRFTYLLPVLLILLFGCSENPSEVTSKISSPAIEMSSNESTEELTAPSFEELESKALEELSRENPTVLHPWHFSSLTGRIFTRCDSEGHLIWGERECRPVAIVLVNTGTCPIAVELKCGTDRIAIEDPRPGEHAILHGVGNHIFVHCLEHGHRCRAHYAIVWLDGE